jgi:hypothetical protein
MLHEITGRQTFDCPRGPQDECEPGGRVLEGAKGDCRQATCTLSTLVDTIDAQRQQGNLSSALRLFVLEFYRSQIPEVEGREGLRELMDRPKPVLS